MLNHLQEIEFEQHGSESEDADQTAEGLQDPGVAEPDLVSRPAPRHEEDVSQQGGRRQPHPGHCRRQV